MKKQSTLILAILFVLISTINAQDEVKQRINNPHQFGIHAGSTTGLGLSYRLWPDKFGFQFTTVPVFHTGGDYYVSAGFAALLKLKEYETYNIFMYYGNHLIFSQNQYYEYDPYPATTYTTISNDEILWNSGLGLGFNIHFNTQFSLDVMCGYGLYDIGGDIHTMLAGEVGLFYTF